MLVTFASARDAARRVAGVAAAARIVRALAEAGHDRVRLAVPGGGLLPADAADDLRRLADGIPVSVVDGDALERTGIETSEIETLALLAAPRLSAFSILRGTAKSDDGPVSRWLNRPVSQLISAALLNIPAVRPLHATLATAFVASAMFAALALGGAPGLIAGGLLFQAASILDGVDGEIARATFRTSAAGAALDSRVDMATNLLFMLGVTINLTQQEGVQAAALGGFGLILLAVGLLLIARLASRGEQPFSFDHIKHRYRGWLSRQIASWLIEFATIVSSRDFFALLFALLIVGGVPMAVLYLFAAAAILWMAFVAAAAFPARHRRPLPERSA